MAYNGYLLKVGNKVISNEDIQADSYQVLYSVTDLDSTRNANGELMRTALEHRVGKIEFNTRNQMTNIEMSNFLKSIRDNYINPNEKSVNVSYYVPELDDYKEQKMYIPDIQFKIYRIDEDKNILFYDATRIAFIAY